MSSDSKSESTAQPKRIKFDNELADTLIKKIPHIFKDPKVAEECLQMLLSIDKPESEELQAKMAEIRDLYQKTRSSDFPTETPITSFIRTILYAYTATDADNLNSFFHKLLTDRDFANSPKNYIESCLQLLIDLGADANHTDHQGWTALHDAAASNNIEAIRLLAPRGNINAQNTDGNTPLFIAVWKGHIDSIKALIEQRADINEIDDNGMTLLHHAAKYGQAEAIRFLVKPGNVNAKDRFGRTPLHFAISSRGGDRADVVRILLEKGADINAADNEGQTPLCTAAASTVANKTVRVLLEYKADVNVKNRRGESPLELAINNLYLPTEAIHLLLAQGAEIGDLYTKSAIQQPLSLRILADHTKASRTDEMKKIDAFIINAINEQNALNTAELPGLLTTPRLTPKDLTAIVADYLQPLDSKAVQLNNELVQPIEWVKKTLIALTDIISCKIHSEKEIDLQKIRDIKAQIELQAVKAIMELASPEDQEQYKAYWDRLQTAREKGEDLYKVPTPNDMYKVLPTLVNTTSAQNESKEYKIETKQMSPTRARAGSFSTSSHQLSSQPTQETPQKQTPDQTDQETHPGQEVLSDSINGTPRGPGFSSSEK